ncbi:MAG: hypothetical protein V4560_07070 [Bacteroidota bacterium]
MTYFLALIFPFASIMIWFFPKRNNGPLGLGDLLMLLVDLWLLLHLYLMNKMVVVTGNSLESNKHCITETLEERYSGIEFSSENPNVITVQKPDGWIRRGKIITIILNNNDLYINTLSTARWGSLSSFLGPIDYFRSKSIAKSFKLAQQ